MPLPQLTALHTEVSAIARARPLVAAPTPVVTLANTLLRAADKSLTDRAAAKFLPRLSRGEVSFAELSLTLGQACAALATQAARDAPVETGHTPEQVAALREKLAARIAAMVEARENELDAARSP